MPRGSNPGRVTLTLDLDLGVGVDALCVNVVLSIAAQHSNMPTAIGAQMLYVSSKFGDKFSSGAHAWRPSRDRSGLDFGFLC